MDDAVTDDVVWGSVSNRSGRVVVVRLAPRCAFVVFDLRDVL